MSKTADFCFFFFFIYHLLLLLLWVYLCVCFELLWGTMQCITYFVMLTNEMGRARERAPLNNLMLSPSKLQHFSLLSLLSFSVSPWVQATNKSHKWLWHFIQDIPPTSPTDFTMFLNFYYFFLFLYFCWFVLSCLGYFMQRFIEEISGPVELCDT